VSSLKAIYFAFAPATYHGVDTFDTNQIDQATDMKTSFFQNNEMKKMSSNSAFIKILSILTQISTRVSDVSTFVFIKLKFQTNDAKELNQSKTSIFCLVIA